MADTSSEKIGVDQLNNAVEEDDLFFVFKYTHSNDEIITRYNDDASLVLFHFEAAQYGEVRGGKERLWCVFT